MVLNIILLMQFDYQKILNDYVDWFVLHSYTRFDYMINHSFILCSY